jgi:cell division protein ZipA
MTANEMRIFLVVVGLLVIGLIYWFGRGKRPTMGRREPFLAASDDSSRVEPSFREGAMDDVGAEDFAADPDGSARTQVDWSGDRKAISDQERHAAEQIGAREAAQFDLIVSLHVMANQDVLLGGAELLVAAEKASLVYGAQGLFHRLVDGRPGAGPIFSMVNRVEPGRFELSKIQEVQTPGVSLFMTLPGPLAALDAWDKMLPAAQRLAGLLNAEIYDEQMNLLGRQRIASIRDELRAYDRKSELPRGRA